VEDDSQPGTEAGRRWVPFVWLVGWLAGFLAVDAWSTGDESRHWMPRAYVGVTLIFVGLRTVLRPPARAKALAAQGRRPGALDIWLERHPGVDRAIGAATVVAGIAFIATPVFRP
jgi:uncharacterized membrane protein YfcA